MRIYETMFIIDPNVEDDARNDLANRVKTWIEEKVKGKVRNFDRWGIRQLAFRVDKFLQGDYTVVIFEAEPQHVKELEDMYRITPQIFRWMIFRREDLEKKEKKAEEAKKSESQDVTETGEMGQNTAQVESENVEPVESVESSEGKKDEEETQETRDEGENS